MKSTQERSNECLPPKKREIPASTISAASGSLPSEQRPLVVSTAGEGQRGNLAWLASVVSVHEGREQRTSMSRSVHEGREQRTSTSRSVHEGREQRTSTSVHVSSHGTNGPQYKPLSSADSSSSSSSFTSSLSALGVTACTSTLLQTGGSTQYSPPSVHFLTPPYAGPYAGYLSPLTPPLPPPVSNAQRSSSSGESTYTSSSSSSSSKLDHHQQQQQQQQQHQSKVSDAVTAVTLAHSTHYLPVSSSAHHGAHLHSPHALGPLVLQYSDPPPGGQPEMVNGDLGRSRRVGVAKQHQQHYEVKGQGQYEALRHVLLPAEYAPDSAGQRPSLTLNSCHSGGSDALTSAGDKGGITRGPTSSSPFLPPLPVDGLKGVIQTSGAGPSVSLGFYPAQSPVLGYMGYPHLLTQPLLVPASAPSSTSAGHTFLAPAAPAKSASAFESPATYPPHAGQVVHLPLAHGSGGLLASPLTPTAPSLPAYFAAGSIIQLADGALKRVEELSTDDFLQSAHVSADLRIDSSTVERITASLTPDHAIVHFAVGEHRAQVSVEVLSEYPFFVFGQGWSSCCPERSTQLLELPCARLSVGDVCISLTLKNLKNGTLKRNPGPPPPPENPSQGTHGTLKPPRAASGERENGTAGQTNAANGELRPAGGEGGALGRPVARKRRWSAPEGRKVERSDEEHLPPKASFLSQEVKTSIEGHSNMG
ncbi:ataxin-1a isoform X2 [Alosa sapidissima]|uniref:ataxin-1a isoform X2 n=1 Tax=Alosa sapidissima TaxID=34773 RepID=UPI001C085810|nr:ataxin-1a isoform X2 [Alosa sapidissima]